MIFLPTKIIFIVCVIFVLISVQFIVSQSHSQPCHTVTITPILTVLIIIIIFSSSISINLSSALSLSLSSALLSLYGHCLFQHHYQHYHCYHHLHHNHDHPSPSPPPHHCHHHHHHHQQFYSQFLATDFLQFESILFFVIYRNGHFLGVAFDNVQYGPGLAYFPAASLSYGESCQMNFGASPFKYSFYCLLIFILIIV